MSASERPAWDDYFRGIARAVAARSSCPRASVGAVIVSPDHRILATGYNGAPSGEPHCSQAGCVMEDNHCQRTLHAEVNAVAHAARWGTPIAGATVYLWSEPEYRACRECRKVLKAAGVELADA